MGSSHTSCLLDLQVIPPQTLDGVSFGHTSTMLHPAAYHSTSSMTTTSTDDQCPTETNREGGGYSQSHFAGIRSSVWSGHTDLHGGAGVRRAHVSDNRVGTGVPCVAHTPAAASIMPVAVGDGHMLGVVSQSFRAC